MSPDVKPTENQKKKKSKVALRKSKFPILIRRRLNPSGRLMTACYSYFVGWIKFSEHLEEIVSGWVEFFLIIAWLLYLFGFTRAERKTKGKFIHIFIGLASFVGAFLFAEQFKSYAPWLVIVGDHLALVLWIIFCLNLYEIKLNIKYDPNNVWRRILASQKKKKYVKNSDDNTRKGDIEISDKLSIHVEQLTSLLKQDEFLEGLAHPDHPSSKYSYQQLERIGGLIKQEDESIGAFVETLGVSFKKVAENKEEEIRQAKISEQNKAKADEFARKMVNPVVEAKELGYRSTRKMAAYFNSQGYKTLRGNDFHSKAISNLIKRQEELGLLPENSHS